MNYYTFADMKEAIFTQKAPNPIGPYSQAIDTGTMIFISGQIAIDPNTNELKTSSIEEETKQAMENLKAILFQANLNFSHVVKSSIFLKDMNQFGLVNEIYAQYFNDGIPPARETVQVSVLPKNVSVEISMIAVKEL